MTVEDCRIILKVHIQAADQGGEAVEAWALIKVLTAIDHDLSDERRKTLETPE